MNAHQRGEGSLSQLAKRFDVSFGWAKKISAALRSTGKMERPPGGPRGPSSRIREVVRQDLRNWIAKQSDLTLAELQVQLYEQRDVEISLSRLWTVLGQMGLRLKKVTPCRRARHGSGPASSQHLAARNGPSRPVEADFYRRERGHHGDDASLWPGTEWGADRRTLAHADGVGRDSRVGMVATMTIEAATDGDILA